MPIGYDMEMEILLKAWRGGFRIASVPIAAKVADGRSTSHFRAVHDTWKICMTFLRTCDVVGGFGYAALSHS